MTKPLHKFIKLLQFSIGTSSEIPEFTYAEMRDVFEMSKQQALVGIMLDGVKKLPPCQVAKIGEQDAWEDLVMDWMGLGIGIARSNIIINSHIASVSSIFSHKGFDCCLLKGQGSAMKYYPNPLARNVGDIDIWLRIKSNDEYSLLSKSDLINKIAQNIQSIIRYIRKYQPNAKAVYHHIECTPYKDTEVEVHYRPQFLFSYKFNKRLQQYFFSHADEQFKNFISLGTGDISVPTSEFNVIFQLSHINNHLFHEGIGLRQILDYYYLCISEELESKGLDKQYWKQQLSYLGLYKIAGAVMWILVHQLGMDKKYILAEPDARRGQFVFNEILSGGNFGRYDERYHFSDNVWGRNFQRLWRDLRLVRYFPSEAFSEPFFRLYHAIWRWKHRPKMKK